MSRSSYGTTTLASPDANASLNHQATQMPDPDRRPLSVSQNRAVRPASPRLGSACSWAHLRHFVTKTSCVRITVIDQLSGLPVPRGPAQAAFSNLGARTRDHDGAVVSRLLPVGRQDDGHWRRRPSDAPGIRRRAQPAAYPRSRSRSKRQFCRPTPPDRLAEDRPHGARAGPGAVGRDAAGEDPGVVRSPPGRGSGPAEPGPPGDLATDDSVQGLSYGIELRLPGLHAKRIAHGPR